MLTRFEVENYKNFKKKIVLDFKGSGGYKFNQDCLDSDIISKLMIYGRNASGKTNLGKAIMDITEVAYFRRTEEIYTNAETDISIASFKYCFEFGKTSVEYVYAKENVYQFVFEALFIDNKKVYSVDYKNRMVETDGLSAISAEMFSVDRYFGALDKAFEDNKRVPTFLRWIAAHSALSKDSIAVVLVDYVDSMRFLSAGSCLYVPLVSTVQRGMFDKFDESFVSGLEHFLEHMGMKCKLVLRYLPEGEKKLYFDYKKPVPFLENASSGTLALFNLYMRIILLAKKSSFVFLDEYDAFYHYEMAENLFNYFKINFPHTQIVFTTHNTNLMTNRISRPDCMFVISLDGRITSLNNATERELREGHNLEKLYISGEFEDYE